MASDWGEATLAQLGRIVTGKTPPSNCPEYFGGDIPFVTPTDFNGRRFIDSTGRYLTEAGMALVGNSRIPAGAVMVSCIGSDMGKAAVAYFDCVTNQQINSIIVEPDNDPLFVYYNLSARKEEFRSVAGGSAQPILKKSAFGRLKIVLPPLPEQRAIAHILGTLDDKIELNRKVNQTLEAIARAIFKSWFVDFDPVIDNALAAGKPIPEEFAERAARRARLPHGKSPLPENIRRLFPDEFQDSELGPIPKGWEVKPIGDVVRCVGGATPSTKNPKYWEGGENPFLTPKDMASLDAPVILNTERHITDAGVEKISSKKLPVGTVLLSSRAPIGYLAINEVPVSVNQGIIAMICDGVLPNYYIFFWVKNNMDVIKTKAGGTTFAEISKRNFRSISALIPSQAVLDEFMGIARSLFQKIVKNSVSSSILPEIRDTLLPKLISGKLRVPNVKKILEDV